MSQEKPRRSKKATNAEMARRIHGVYQLILSGASRPDIIQHAQEKWGVGEASADDYMARARVHLQQAIEEERPEALHRHLLLRRDMLQRARQTGDIRIELEVARDEAKLLDLYPTEKRDVSGSVELNVRNLPDLPDGTLAGILTD